MPNTRVNIITNIPIMFMVGMLALLTSCENDLEEIERVSTPTSLPMQTIKDATITYTDSGRTEFIVKAGKIDRFKLEEDPFDRFTKGVVVLSFNKDGTVASEITSRRATNFPSRNIMVARDSVVLKDDEGNTLFTEQLTWNEKTKKIYTDKFVRITTPDEILFGDGLEANQDFSSYEIMNIKGRIKVEEGDSTANENTVK